ncbi:unnamed protein product [Brassica oleracea]
MSLFSDLVNLNLSDSTKQIIAEYIWSHYLYATPFRDAVKKTNGEEDSKSSLLVDDHGSMLKKKGIQSLCDRYIIQWLFRSRAQV